MTRHYSPSELAQTLDTGSHTVRRYGDRFARHLSPGAGSRPRRYTDQDAGILAEALRLKEAGHAFAEIDTLLEQTVIASPPAVQDSQPTGAPQPTEALLRLASAVEAMSTQQAMLDALQARLARVEAAQGDARRLALAVVFGVVLGVLLVLVGAAVYVGIAG